MTPPPIVLRLRGHLSLEQLNERFESADPSLSPGVSVIVDCLEMEGYDAAARARFVEWFRGRRQSIRRTAVVTTQLRYRLVVATMSLASGISMQCFATFDEARAWSLADE